MTPDGKRAYTARPLEERLWKRVDKTSSRIGCWLWTGAANPRYGQIGFNYKKLYVHRLVWELLRGPIPEGFVIDHLCRVELCCNPDHLEPVTCKENLSRGYGPSISAAAQLAKTHCPQGHPYSGANLLRSGGKRHCRTCLARHEADYRRRAREQAVPCGHDGCRYRAKDDTAYCLRHRGDAATQEGSGDPLRSEGAACPQRTD